MPIIFMHLNMSANTLAPPLSSMGPSRSQSCCNLELFSWHICCTLISCKSRLTWWLLIYKWRYFRFLHFLVLFVCCFWCCKSRTGITWDGFNATWKAHRNTIISSGLVNYPQYTTVDDCMAGCAYLHPDCVAAQIVTVGYSTLCFLVTESNSLSLMESNPNSELFVLSDKGHHSTSHSK